MNAAQPQPVIASRPSEAPRPGSFGPIAWRTVAKDLRLEWRSKDALNAMLFFALLVVVIFSFAFDLTSEEARRITGGLVWVAFLFSTTMAVNQSWARELSNQVLDGFRISPAPPNALFIGKALANFVLVLVLEAIVAPLFIVFFNLRVLGNPWLLLWIFVLGTWALVVNGAFFAAMSLRTRSRELMLPLLLFPITIPALLAAVGATTAVLTGELSAALGMKFLAAYDVVFTMLALLLFETVLNAE